MAIDLSVGLFLLICIILYVKLTKAFVCINIVLVLDCVVHTGLKLAVCHTGQS